MSPIRFGAPLALALLTFAPSLEAAPGKLTPTGPFELSGAARELVYPGADPRRILLLSQEDLFETRDGGVNWRSMLLHGPEIVPENLIVDPSDADHWYLMGIAERRRTVIETRDGGRSWSTLARPAGSWPDSRFMNFFLDAAEPRTLVAEYHERFARYEYFLSRDGGATWSQRNPPENNDKMLGVHRSVGWTRNYQVDFRTGTWTPHAPFGSLRKANTLFFDRVRSDTFFIDQSSGGMARTTDGGQTFSSMEASVGAFSQSPVNPSHLATSWQSHLSLSLDRGRTFTVQEEMPFALRTAFDPASGEVLLQHYHALHRRRQDGSLAPPLPTHGLSVFEVYQLAAGGGQALMLDTWSRLYGRDEEGTWRFRGKVTVPLTGTSYLDDCSSDASILISPSAPRKVLVVCSQNAGVFLSGDGGRSFSFTPVPLQTGDYWGYGYPPNLALARSGAAETVYFLRRGEGRFAQVGGSVQRSTDFGATWENLGTGFLEIVVHPDAARGILGVRQDGRLMRYLPGGSWQEVATAASQRFLPDDLLYQDLGFGYDPAHPELVYAYYHLGFYRSLDFGGHWELVAGTNEAFEASGIPWDWLSSIPAIRVDPADANHFLFVGQSISTRDGGRTFQFDPAADGWAAIFDPEMPGRLLASSATAGVLEITPSLPPCPDTPAAWCAGGGRYLVTVDWKDPQGNEGKATKVVTGSEDSGLFYFFDRNNWELLVKVLDGCGFNDRVWVLAAGTTDVEYVMKVEDRWTGQIRHYANAAGRAAPAVIDTDAFSGCGQAPPPGAAAALLPGALLPQALAPEAGGETALLLAGGRFEVKTRWTDFSGTQGDGTTAPLSSDNSGLFYFFSPNNWEVLVKVLDGCAINNHFWVLAAATTDVGYRLEVRDTQRARTKTYTNPVGQAAPAQIDLQAFSCQ